MQDDPEIGARERFGGRTAVGRACLPARALPAPPPEAGWKADRRPGGRPHVFMLLGLGLTVQDAWFAALATESGCEWITTDRDCARFEGLC